MWLSYNIIYINFFIIKLFWITSLIDINSLLIRLSHKLAALGWPKRLLGRLGIIGLLFCRPSLSSWLGLPVGETHLFVECCQAGGLHDVGELWRLLGQVLAPVTAWYCGLSWIGSGTENMEVWRANMALKRFILLFHFFYLYVHYIVHNR